MSREMGERGERSESVTSPVGFDLSEREKQRRT